MKQYSTTVGSGTVPHVGYGPAHNLPADAFPGAHSKNELRTRIGDGMVLLNPEDFSVSIGGRVSQVNVGGTPVEAIPDPLEYRRALVIHNNGPQTLYFGFDASVSSSNGFPLVANEKIAIDMNGTPNVSIWLVTAGVTVDVRLLELA